MILQGSGPCTRLLEILNPLEIFNPLGVPNLSLDWIREIVTIQGEKLIYSFG